MPAFEPGWDTFSCRCRSRLHRVRTPLAVLPSCSASPRSTGRRVAAVVSAVAMAVASTHAHTRFRSRPRACAPTHVHAFSREGEDPTLSSLCRSTEAELAGIPPRRAKAPPSAVLFHPDGASAGLFLSSHARSRACTRRPSQAEATPAVPPSRSALVRRDAAHPRARSSPVSAPVPLSTRVHPCAPRGCELTAGAQPRLARSSPARGQCRCIDPPSRRPWPRPHHEGHPLPGRSFRALADQ
jgi:hypothetical protein